MLSKYTNNFTIFVILVHFLKFLGLKDTFLILGAYFKFEVHNLMIYRKSSTFVNIFHESRLAIIIIRTCAFSIKTIETKFYLNGQRLK